jgi:antitoxin (DNA-binding transcriptional repressor) of toxin-antitoxin stability system
MTTYSTAEAPSKLEEILDKVRDGETIVLFQEGKAVAEIRPVAGGSEEAVLRQLEEEGILSPPGERPMDFVPLAERPGALARFLESRR